MPASLQYHEGPPELTETNRIWLEVKRMNEVNKRLAALVAQQKKQGGKK